MTTLHESPARIIEAPEGRSMALDIIEYDGEVKKCSTGIAIKQFEGDKTLWTATFTLGWDEEEGYWAVRQGVAISTMKTEKALFIGYELGDTIIIDGQSFTIAEDNNQNIKFI